MQVETPEVSAEKATTHSAVTLEMLQERLATVRRGLVSGPVNLMCMVNGHNFALSTDSFLIDDSGRLELALPDHLRIETINCGAPTRAEEAFDNSLRTLHVVDMASVFGTEELDSQSLEDPLEEFLDALSDQPLRHASLQPLAEVLTEKGWPVEEDEDKREHAREVLVSNAYRADEAGLHGLAVQFGTPRRKYRGPTSFSESWGVMKTVWVYANSFEEAYRLGIEWAQLEHEKELSKSGFVEEAENV